tara:strand:- start:1708 stop:1899 length:192 start_codon:yes stop_codon:yes gene_type:complete
MCIICVELQKNKLTSFEARSNLREIGPTIQEDHRMEVLQLIWDKEDEETNNFGVEETECVGSD